MTIELEKRIAVLETLVASLYFGNNDILLDPRSPPLCAIPLREEAREVCDALNHVIVQARDDVDIKHEAVRKAADLVMKPHREGKKAANEDQNHP